MNYSAILITTTASHLEKVCLQLQTIPQVTLHFTDQATGRLICVIESSTIPESVRIFESLQALEDVLDVSLIEHHFEPADA